MISLINRERLKNWISRLQFSKKRIFIYGNCKCILSSKDNRGMVQVDITKYTRFMSFETQIQINTNLLNYGSVINDLKFVIDYMNLHHWNDNVLDPHKNLPDV